MDEKVHSWSQKDNKIHFRQFDFTQPDNASPQSIQIYGYFHSQGDKG